ncbi:MAG: SDR family oxidoreductase [Streptosporangiales bacterium]|nr:SDR family oxidoreductase [Streptosporangiales bacterium]
MPRGTSTPWTRPSVRPTPTPRNLASSSTPGPSSGTRKRVPGTRSTNSQQGDQIVTDRTDSVFVITGSAAGIGRAIALRAARGGARVVVNSRKAEKLDQVTKEIEDAGGEALAVGADLRDPEQVDTLVQRTLERWQRIDVLVNNAAGRFLAAAEQISPGGWRAVVEANLTTAFLCSRAVFPVFRERGGGRIINISSVGAYGPNPGGAHYGAAKAALNSLTETLAYEWGRYGIQVNGVAPGPVLTEASRYAQEEQRRLVEAKLPGGRIAMPDEIAEFVLSLAQLRTPYLNGETVRVDGALRGMLHDEP